MAGYERLTVTERDRLVQLRWEIQGAIARGTDEECRRLMAEENELEKRRAGER